MVGDLKTLRKKLLMQISVLVGIMLAAGIALNAIFAAGLFDEPFRNFCTAIFRMLLGMEQQNALYLYYRIFSDNKGFWLLIAVGVVLLLCVRLCAKWFFKYFTLVDEALDQLDKEPKQHVQLPEELEFVAVRLNQAIDSIEQQRQEAQAAEQRKDELIVYLAHDIKTPLTSIIGYISLMQEEQGISDEQMQQYLALIMNKSLHLQQLVDEIFDITRFNTQTMTLEKQWVDLTFLLQQLCDEFLYQVAARGQSLQLEVDTMPRVQLDAEKMARVFSNLLKNAISYGQENSEIKIGISCENAHAVVRISNQGSTIPEHEMNSIFEKFYRLDPARSSYTGGAGLGLAIAREIVLAHGGDISVQSAEGSTVFTVSVPLCC